MAVIYKTILKQYFYNCKTNKTDNTETYPTQPEPQEIVLCFQLIKQTMQCQQ